MKVLRRSGIAFTFGLLYAWLRSALSEVGVPQTAIPSLFFNVGVEIGQLCHRVCLVITLARRVMRRFAVPQPV
jgi:hypothetical protein